MFNSIAGKIFENDQLFFSKKELVLKQKLPGGGNPNGERASALVGWEFVNLQLVGGEAP